MREELDFVDLGFTERFGFTNRLGLTERAAASDGSSMRSSAGRDQKA